MNEFSDILEYEKEKTGKIFIMIIASIIAVILGGTSGVIYADYLNKKDNEKNAKKASLTYTDNQNAYMDVIVDWEIDDKAPKTQNRQIQKNIQEQENKQVQQKKQKIEIEIN